MTGAKGRAGLAPAGAALFALFVLHGGRAAAAEAPARSDGLVVLLVERDLPARTRGTLAEALGARLASKVETRDLSGVGLKGAGAARACAAEAACRPKLVPAGADPSVTLLVVVEEHGGAVRLDAWRAADGAARGAAVASSVSRVADAIGPSSAGGGPGTLVVRAPPGALLSLNGFPFGEATGDAAGMALPPLRSGAYVLHVERDGAAPVDSELFVRPGLQYLEVHFVPGRSGATGGRRSSPLPWILAGAGVIVAGGAAAVLTFFLTRVPDPPVTALGDFRVFR